MNHEYSNSYYILYSYEFNPTKYKTNWKWFYKSTYDAWYKCIKCYCHEICNVVSKSVSTLIAKLNSHPAVPRSFTVELIHNIEDIMSHIETLKEACSTLPESSLNLLKIFDTLQNVFIYHKTEHQSLNYF